MGRFVIAAASLAFLCSTSFAQMSAPAASSSMGGPGGVVTAAPPPPGAGAAAAALDGAGVPLGATELFVGGLSPSTSDIGFGCPSTVGVGMLGTGAVFSGDGTLATSAGDISGTAAASTGCSIDASASVGPLGSSSTTGAASSFVGGNIPLAATALPSTGLGGAIAVPGTISSCTSVGAPALTTPGLQSPLPGAAPIGGVMTGSVC